MARENYYKLLKLKIDPPENDTKIIQATIEKQLQIWREAVKKGMNKAKFEEYLTLEDDMKKVMLNPGSRSDEAEFAKVYLLLDKYSSDPSIVQIEGIVTKKLQLGDIYTFLSQKAFELENPAKYSMNSTLPLLKKRSQELCEVYRNLSNCTDRQNLAGYCVNVFSSEQSKKKYDEYIQLRQKKNVIDLVEAAFKLSAEISFSDYEKIIKKTVNNYCSETEVKKFISLFCQRHNYPITLYDTNTHSAPKPTHTQPPKPAPQPQPPKPAPQPQPETKVENSIFKQQVLLLQRDIVGLKRIISSQDNHIKSLMIQGNDLNGQQKKCSLDKTKGAVMQQYAFKEYVDLCCSLAKNNTISQKEQQFFDIYKSMLHGVTVQIPEKVFVREYLMEHYRNQIEQLKLLNSQDIVYRVEATRID